MMRTGLFVMAAIFGMAAGDASAAQRMRDMSLSVDDTMKEPDITYEHDYLKFPSQGQGQGSSSFGKSGLPRGLPGERTPYGGIRGQTGNEEPYGTGRFMAAYCDPNFNAGIAAGQGLQACLDNAKQKACEMYERQPRDVQSLLDHALSCAFSADDPVYGGEDTTCYEDDGRRLRMVKKYWSDEETVYALIFLPDMVQAASTDCRGGY